MTAKGNKRVCPGLPPRLIEYNKLSYFWEKFGLNKFDLEKCSPEWVSEMYSVGLGVDKARAEGRENAQRARGGGGSISDLNPRAAKGSRVVSTKLL